MDIKILQGPAPLIATKNLISTNSQSFLNIGPNATKYNSLHIFTESQVELIQLHINRGRKI
jgi:hypothetical protein